MIGRKAALGVVSILLLLSMGGGFLLLPALVPLHVWAARRSGSVGRLVWSAVPVLAASMATWCAVYLALGEAKPWIWLVPVGAAIPAAYGVLRVTDPTLDLGVVKPWLWLLPVVVVLASVIGLGRATRSEVQVVEAPSGGQVLRQP